MSVIVGIKSTIMVIGYRSICFTQLNIEGPKFLKFKGSNAKSLRLVMYVMVHGKRTCPTCGGDGQIESSGPCTAHTVSGGHYYCTSSSHHGNNVAQYHK